MSFVHLHNHSCYSLLSAVPFPSQIINKAKSLNHKAVALTDNSNLYSAFDFYNEAKKSGIKPIIGVDFNICKDRFLKDVNNKSTSKLLLIAKNIKGYKNLIELITIANLEGFYYKPRIDYNCLKAHSDGLICIIGGLASDLSKTLLIDDKKKSMDLVDYYKDVFANDLYFEIVANDKSQDLHTINYALKSLSEITSIPLVLTCDSYYLNSEDESLLDILMCIGNGRNISDPNRFRFSYDASIKSDDYLLEFSKDFPNSYVNTQVIADKCLLDIPLDLNLLPKFKTPNSIPSNQYLKELCIEGIRKKYKDTKLALERLDYELSVISPMGFDDYFLIVHDFVQFAKNEGIIVGPGRGSAAGSIIAYALDITTVDPLKYGLYFERFLNPERVSMPDIDIDFEDARRSDVLDYVVNKYGRRSVSQVITFGTMSAKAVVRDVGRAMGYEYSEVDAIAKRIPPPVLGKHKPLRFSVKEHPDLKQVYDENPRAKALLDNAIKLEGTVRNTGTHACAVVLSENPLTDHTPLQYAAGKDDSIVSQYSMNPLEKIGLLKVDFLGLRNLTIIQKALDLIKTTKGIDIDIANIPLDDKASYQLLAKGLTVGVFQLESKGMQRYLKELIPSSIYDIIAMNALYRPGPMEFIPQYIEGKHDPDSIEYMHPVFEPILKETYGIGVYQEQILEIAKSFAGFTLGEADLLRKAVGKKIPELLAEQRTKFINGAESEGHDPEFAKQVFDDVIEPFAGYGFNKSHATCYAMIAYQTAYLKANYTVEFMAALLASDLENTDRVVLDILECKELGISVLPPNINESDVDFKIIDEKTIRFGLGAIKGLGTSSMEQIINVRNQLKGFDDLEDLLSNVPSNLINKKNIEALAYSGALDDFADRFVLVNSVENLSLFAKNSQKSALSGQSSLFSLSDDIEIEKIKLAPYSQISDFEKLQKEKEVLGLYVSSHPLDKYMPFINKNYLDFQTIDDIDSNTSVVAVSMVTSVNTIITKRGQTMMKFILSNPFGDIPCIVFPNTFKNLSFTLAPNDTVMVKGKLDKDRGTQIIVNDLDIVNLDNLCFKEPEPILLDFELEPNKDNLQKVKDLLAKHHGDIPVFLRMSKLEYKKVKLPLKIDPTDAFYKNWVDLNSK